MTRTADPSRRALATFLQSVDDRDPLLIVKAPPGSGKTYLIECGAALSWSRGESVAIATQTNAQADDIARRLATNFPTLPVYRFTSSSHDPVGMPATATVISQGKDLPRTPAVVIAVADKWALTDVANAFDVLFVDEAWQMKYSHFELIAPKLAPRFVLVGDPGQIPPVVAIDASRWATAKAPPHRATPAVLLQEKAAHARTLSLPISRRLPHDSAALVRTFYDFDFDAFAPPGTRRLRVSGPARRTDAVDRAIEQLTTGSITMLSLPTPANGPPLEDDPEIAANLVATVERLLERGATIVTEDGERALTAEDIGVCATHRVTNARIARLLGPRTDSVRVDTAERWQGLERPVMVVVHPLSGVTHPSAFDLETGRLCVMLSRHRVGVVIVGRDHIAKTLDDHTPSADHRLGEEDVTGRGHAQHRSVLRWLERTGRLID